MKPCERFEVVSGNATVGNIIISDGGGRTAELAGDGLEACYDVGHGYLVFTSDILSPETALFIYYLSKELDLLDRRMIAAPLASGEFQVVHTNAEANVVVFEYFPGRRLRVQALAHPRRLWRDLLSPSAWLLGDVDPVRRRWLLLSRVPGQ